MRQVLQYLFHVNDTGTLKGDARYQNTLEMVQAVWEMARISTLTNKTCMKKLKSLFEEWKGLRKSSNRRTKADAAKTQKFMEKLDRLWDIGAEDAIDVIKRNRLLTEQSRADDISFYLDQRGPRNATMSGQDKVLANKTKLQEHRKNTLSRQHTAEHESDVMEEGAYCEDTSADSETEVDRDPTTTVQHPISSSRLVTLNLPRSILTSPPVIEMADRLNLSNNQVCARIFLLLSLSIPLSSNQCHADNWIKGWNMLWLLS